MRKYKTKTKQMITKRKTYPVALRMDQWVVDEVGKLADIHNMDRSEIYRIILAAGVKAVVENGGGWYQPMTMKLVEPRGSYAHKTTINPPPLKPARVAPEKEKTFTAHDVSSEIREISQKHRHPKT